MTELISLKSTVKKNISHCIAQRSMKLDSNSSKKPFLEALRSQYKVVVENYGRHSTAKATNLSMLEVHRRNGIAMSVTY